MAGPSKAHKSERRSSSSKGHTSSSTQPQPQPSTWPPISFLFVVNALPVNDDVPPRTDLNGRWHPPLYSAGFSPQVRGRVYRWRDGRITAAPQYQWYDGRGWGPGNTQLTNYRASTVFYCNPWDQFEAAEGDASTRDIANSQFPYHRWYPLSFQYHGGLSRIDFSGEQRLAGSGAGWLDHLGLRSYDNLDPNAPIAAGLAGNLATLIALLAFSCRFCDLDAVLLNDRAWRNYQWRGHGRQDGRRDTRGMVVSIYLDPENDQGSTRETLVELEWTQGHLVQ